MFYTTDDTQKLPRFSGYDESHVKKVVELNDKQRFTLRKSPLSGKLHIRANQGHTIQASHTKEFLLKGKDQYGQTYCPNSFD
jgi:RNA:NAD 2'-phosphotransferase (TPT1/KptA family)